MKHYPETVDLICATALALLKTPFSGLMVLKKIVQN